MWSDSRELEEGRLEINKQEGDSMLYKLCVSPKLRLLLTGNLSWILLKPNILSVSIIGVKAVVFCAFPYYSINLNINILETRHPWVNCQTETRLNEIIALYTALTYSSLLRLKLYAAAFKWYLLSPRWARKELISKSEKKNLCPPQKHPETLSFSSCFPVTHTAGGISVCLLGFWGQGWCYLSAAHITLWKSSIKYEGVQPDLILNKEENLLGKG